MKPTLMEKRIKAFIEESGGIDKALKIIQTRVDKIEDWRKHNYAD